MEKMNRKKPLVFLDVSIDGDPFERMTFELFTDVAPKTAENFRALCTGEKGLSPKTGKPLHYKGTFFHRIIKGCMAQGGDFLRQDGKYGESISDGNFLEGSPKLKHDGPGLLSMSISDRDERGSLFSVTFKADHHLDRECVVFGKLVGGHEVLKKIENAGDEEGKPAVTVKITNSGELPEDKKKGNKLKMGKDAVEENNHEVERMEKCNKSSKKRKGKRKRRYYTSESDSDSDSYGSSLSDTSSSSDDRRKKRKRSKRDTHRRGKKDRRREKRRKRQQDKKSRRKSRRDSASDSESDSKRGSSSKDNAEVGALDRKPKSSVADRETAHRRGKKHRRSQKRRKRQQDKKSRRKSRRDSASDSESDSKRGSSSKDNAEVGALDRKPKSSEIQVTEDCLGVLGAHHGEALLPDTEAEEAGLAVLVCLAVQFPIAIVVTTVTVAPLAVALQQKGIFGHHVLEGEGHLHRAGAEVDLDHLRHAIHNLQGMQTMVP